MRNIKKILIGIVVLLITLIPLKVSAEEDTIYDDEYKDFELALKNKLQVMNVFVSNVWIKEEQDKC